jgi:hypothetical protein
MLVQQNIDSHLNKQDHLIEIKALDIFFEENGTLS